ncbi:4-amino-4-deoxy-L-arabinose transferase [Burkholderia sp. WAC0059]|uniref:SMR family transporter n=1 Tax=Burkholderia sp. WAC0059 TaxID=2066022 RepID=UPI000C7F65A8|nr:SMR family transporter [Burkholderia sp. WAC0059]PLZ03224.1 4-amino-4-deoxy-L-arabinose transferase [Burkholderia sp. WAC0059]
MNILSFVLILSGVMLNAAAQLFLKAGTHALGLSGFSRHEIVASLLRVAFEPHILGGLACYAISVVVWIAALSRVEVSVAYPMLSIGYVVNAFAAWYLFGEALSAQKLAGIAVIIVGVCLVARA